MDDLAKKLRSDAERIDVAVSPQLEDRIRASLESATQEGAAPVTRKQPVSLWWASSLTGIAAAAAVIAIININKPGPDAGITEPPPPSLAASRIDFNLKPAVLTQTLEQELADIQSDLRKAEQAVRDDLPQTRASAEEDEGL